MIAKNFGAADERAKVDEAVQAVHSHSENHEEAQVRQWADKLEEAVDALKDSIEKGESTAAKKTSGENTYEIRIKDHTFTPSKIKAPAGEKIKLVVYNDDPTPEEFESDDFRREKIIPGNTNATIFVGPLEPGKYHFFGEFNMDKANGYLIVE